MALPIPSKKLRDYSKYNKDGLRILLQNRHITVFDNATSYELMAVVCLYECGLLATGITIEDNYLTRFPILKEASAWWKGTKSEVVKVADQRRIGSGGYKYQVIERLLLALNMGNSTSSAPSQVPNPLSHLRCLQLILCRSFRITVPRRSRVAPQPTSAVLSRTLRTSPLEPEASHVARPRAPLRA